jgi:autotransporter-associated beta strand protein
MTPSRTPRRTSFVGAPALGWLLVFCGFVTVARAQFSYSEDFKNSTAPGWVLNPAGNSTPGPLLTSGASVRAGDPESGTIDPSGSGWLRLTNNTLNQANAVYFDTPIPSAGNSVTIAFGANFWGGNNFVGTGADGVTFFLYDASKTFSVGSSGGAIGYAQGLGLNPNGLSGGYVGVAFDPYGNFSTTNEGRQGGPGTALVPNTVAVRGPGQGITGYNYLAGTGYRDLTDTGVATTLDPTDGTVPAVPYTMAFPTATARPNQSTQYRNISVTINESSQLSVSMQFGEDGLWYQLLNVDLSSFVRPEQLKMGFAAGTGDGTLITEVGGLLTIQATAGTGNFIWDKRNGPGDAGLGGGSIWGTGTDDPLNWAGQTNPTLKSNVIFNSTYLAAVDPQAISVNGSDKVITNMYLSGKNSYTLTTGEARKLIFDSNTPGGLTSISLTNDVGGNAAHTIGLDVQMNQNLDINNSITPTFTISGNIDIGGNVLGLKGTGTTVLAGALSGTGSLAKSDAGTTRLTGAGNNTYSGATTVTGGTLQIEKATALGSTAAGTTVAAGGTLALAGTGTTFAAEGLTINGDGVSNAGALRNVAGVNTWTGTVALGTTGSNSVGVDAGSLNLSGVVSGAAGNTLTKVGNGTLSLSGTNTYSGATTLNAGTVALASDGNLGTAPGAATAGQLTLNGGTLQNTAVMTLNANRGIALGTSGGTFQTDANLTYNGIAAGTGALTKTGSATLVLGGANTYTGATHINQGTLQLGANNVLANSTAVTVASGATFDVATRTDTIGSLAGAGAVTLGAAGALTAGADNTSTTYTGNLSGTGANSFTKSGTGTMTLGGTAGSNAFAPATLNLTGGTVQLAASNLLAGAVVFGGGTLSLNGQVESVTSGSLTAATASAIDFNSLAGSLSLSTAVQANNVFGAGATLVINNWAGSTAGGGASQFLVGAADALSTSYLAGISFTGYVSGAKIIPLSGGLFEVVPNTGTASTWNIDSNGNWNTAANWAPSGVPNGTGATANFDSAISAPRTVTQNLAGATVGYMNFENASAYTLSGANRIVMNVSAGSAQINVAGTGAHTINTGLTLNDALVINQNSTGTLTVGAANSITGTNQNLTVNGAGNTTITGTVTTGTGTLTKNNAGTLTLSGVNTFTGATTINGGTVAISAESGLGSNPGTLNAGQLTLNGGTLRTVTSAVLIDDTRRGITIGTNGGTIETVSNLTIGRVNDARNVLTMTGTLTKTGAGTLTLLGDSVNTGNGAVTITGGALTLSKSSLVSAIGDTAAVTVGSGAVLNLNAPSATYNAETVGSLAGAGTIDNVGTFGAFTLTTGGDNTSTTFSGIIKDTGSNLTVVKAGTGTLTLSGVNDYSGATTISAGAINIQSNTALGTTTGGTSVTTGAALEVQNNLTVTGEALTLNGTGVTAAPAGALRNVSGANTLTGALTLGSASTIQSDAGTLTLSGGITGASFGLTLAGAGNVTLTGVIGTTSGTLTKSGTGYATLAGNNTYTGASALNAGTLEIQNNTGLGTSAGATTIATGATLALSGGITTAEPITLNSTGVGGGGALRNLSGANTLSGALTLASASSLGVDGSSTLTASGIISGTTKDLTKVGTGTLILSGANTYTGTTAVSAGTLEINNAVALGGVVTTVADGASLRVTGTALTVSEGVTLNGAGVGGAGALQSSGGSNTWSGNLTMTAHSAIGVDGATNTLAATGTLASSGGDFNLTKVGNGTLVLSGANSYTGSTTVRDGTLSVNANAPIGGNGALGSSSTTVQLGDASTAAGNNLGLVIGTATGGVSVDRAISVNPFNTAGTTTLGGTNTSGTTTFTGNIGLGKDTLLTSATGGTVALTGDLSGTGALTANGTGTVVLSGNNTLSGAATVNSGATLVAASSNALGGTAAGTTVNSGGTLGLQGGLTVPAAETITLSGTGVSALGALRNVSGDNTVAGNITLAASSSLGATAGTATLTGIVSGSGFSLTKVGAGDVVLGGTSANTYTGGTTVSAGTLTLNKTPGLDATGPSGTISVNTGGTLALGADHQINNAVTLALNGGTFQTNNHSDTLGNLSLLASSSLNFSNGDSSVLTFTNAARTAGILTVADWNGIPTVGGGGSQLVFTNAGTGFGATDIAFTGFGTGWTRLGSGEIVPIVTGGASYTWNTNAAGALNTAGNWTVNSGSFLANGATNDTAIFGNNLLSAARAVDATGGRTLGYLAFSGTSGNNFTLNNSTLTLAVTAGNAQIQVDDTAAPTINSALALSNNLNLSSSSTGTLTVNGGISGTARNITVNGTGTVDLNGVIATTTGTLTKAGTSTLILGAANSYTGATTVNNGTLQLDVSAPNAANGALGNASSAVILGSAASPVDATLSLLTNGAGVDVGRALTVGNFGTSTTIGGLNSTGTSTFSGAITLNKTATLTAAAGGTVDFTGILSGTGGLTKTGAGTVTIGGAASNTFTGHVDIAAGTLSLNKITGFDVLGATQGAIGDLAAVTLSGATAVLSVGGPAGQTLEEIGSLAGVAGATVNVAQATAFTLYTGNNNSTTIYAGTLTDTGGNLSLVKQGTGTMTLSGANTYDGTTTVSAGTLVAAHNTALGTATGNTTVAGNATLGLQGGITIAGEQLNLTAITSPNVASLANLSGTNTYGGNIAMTGAVSGDQVKFDAAAGSQLTLSGVISEATNTKVFAKTGTGTLVLTGANTYTGNTLVAGGTLVVAHNAALGAAAGGTTVNIGATLGLQNDVTVAAGETYTLNGTASPAAPSLKNISGSNTLDGAITLSGGTNTGVTIDANLGTLTLSGAITQASASPITNFVTKTGAGTLTLSGTSANTFLGSLNLNDGSVIAAKTAGLDATGAGNVFIGDSIGAAASATLQLTASNQIKNTSAVTIATDGKLDLQGNSDTIGALTLTGGSVTATGAGTLTLGGNLTFTGTGANTASITANVDLGTTGTRIFQIGNNGSNADVDTTLTGVISGGTGSFNKTDLGVLELAGITSNTFTGGFQVSDGTVLLNKTAGSDTTGGGTAVTVGDNVNAAGTALLKLGQNSQIKDTATVTVNSDGKFDLNGLTETIGAIAGTGNIETRAGTLTLRGTASTSAFSGTLTDSTGTIVADPGIPGFSNGKVSVVGSGRVILDMDTDLTGTVAVPSGSLTFNSNIAYAGTLELKSGTLFMPGVQITVGTLEITGTTILDFGNSAASILNTTNIRLAPGASLTITNWVNNVDFFFAENWLAGTTVPGINTRGVGDETQITFTGFSNTQTAWLDYNNAAKHQITPVPEPATYGALFMAAALALLGYRRWKKNAPTAPAA